MVQLLTFQQCQEKVKFCIFLLCILTGVSNAEETGSGFFSICPFINATNSTADVCPNTTALEPTPSTLMPISPTMTSSLSSMATALEPMPSLLTPISPTMTSSISSMAPIFDMQTLTASIMMSTTDNSSSVPSTPMFSSPTLFSSETLSSTESMPTVSSVNISIGPITSPTQTTNGTDGTAPSTRTTDSTTPSTGTTDGTTPSTTDSPTPSTTDGTTGTTQGTPAESGITLSTKLLAAIIAVGCGIIALLICIVCCSVLVHYARRNTHANIKKRGLMQHVKVTVLGDAELADTTDYSHDKKDAQSSCENFLAHLAAAEAEGEEESEGALNRTEQGGDKAKKDQEAVTVGTFGFPMVVIESSKDSGQESSENAENKGLDKSQDDKAQSESKMETSSSGQDKSTTDETSKSSAEKPKPSTDTHNLPETSTGAQKVQEVTGMSSKNEVPKNQTSSVQSAKLQDSKVAASESPFEFPKLLEPKADDALTLAIKNLHDGKIDANQETGDIQEANEPKSDAPASKTTADKKAEDEGASSGAKGAESRSLTDAEKALEQMLKDLDITHL